MLIEAPTHTEVFGSLKIYGVQKVMKLESSKSGESPLYRIDEKRIESVLDKFAVIIPIKNEKLNLLDGVLKAIPDNCPVIIVSNSTRRKYDQFRIEEDLITHFHNLTEHPICLIHQKDPGLALAFKETGYTHILDERGLVRNGKGEGMIVGILLAKYLGKRYLGFIDADNYIPGAVSEYIKDFAAGFCMSESPYTMVRLHWRYKPKIIKNRLYFRKWGRVSEITNRYLNYLLAHLTGFETDIIRTGNAGEHAMTVELADIMKYSTGYSVEPYQLVYLLEEFGKGESEHLENVEVGVEMFQIETLNPHLHEEKGKKHIKKMLLESLSTIYHSKLSTDGIRSEILEELQTNSVLDKGQEPEKNLIMPAIGEIDVRKFMKILSEHSKTFIRMG